MTPCACCRADCYPDEYRADDYIHGAAIEAQFGGPVCAYCMDNLVQPEDGDGAFALKQNTTEDIEGGGYWLCSSALHVHRLECAEYWRERAGR